MAFTQAAGSPGSDEDSSVWSMGDLRTSESVFQGRTALVNGLEIAYHPATEDDILRLALRLQLDGERESPAEVDGRSTGWASPDIDTLYRMVGELMIVDQVLPGAEPVPGSFDLSTRATFPAVGDQAHQPSCSAWAGTYYAYGFLEAEDNEWTSASTGDDTQLLSPAWTYNMVNGGRDRGSWVGENMMVIRDWGVATLAEMPFDDEDYLSWGSPEAFREAALHRAAEVFDLEYNPTTLVDDIKQLVFSGTPVTFGIDALEYSAAFSDGNYIVSSYEYDSTDLNHAQTIVGFDDAVVDDGDNGAFRVVNSWSADWGDAGYYWLTYDTFDEIGPLSNQHMNYIADIEAYQPTLLSVWHFDDTPSRSSGITVGLGPASSPLAEKTPFYMPDPSPSHAYPSFMCLDISEAEDYYPGSSDEFFLTIGASPNSGVISSFKMERYESLFLPGLPSQASEQSSDVPASTPDTVTCSFDYYSPISVPDALDVSSLIHSTHGAAGWVSVPHEFTTGGSSLRSGDVADSRESVFEVEMAGPYEVSFDWMVSSEPGMDLLVFEVSSEGTIAQVSGGTGWEQVTTSLGAGEHLLSWTYVKDEASSEAGDCGWIDNLNFYTEVIPPTVQLEPRYDTVCNEVFTVSPLALSNPSGSDIVVKYDWGDGSPWTEGDPGDSYSASHTYTSVEVFTLAVYVTDDHENNVSDTAAVHVADSNSRPSIVDVELSFSGSYVTPGTTVEFTLTVVDLEGDLLEATFDSGTGAPVSLESQDSDPDTELVFEFSFEYEASDDDPYMATFTISDDQEHFESGWDTHEVSILVNNPPVAALTVDPESADVGSEVAADASGSSDVETSGEELLVRWDWDGDGTWDTEWSSEKTAGWTYLAPGEYTLVVEVMDSAGLTDTEESTVTVSGEAIPEFSSLLVPSVIMLVIVILIARSRRYGREQ